MPEEFQDLSNVIIDESLKAEGYGIKPKKGSPEMNAKMAALRARRKNGSSVISDNINDGIKKALPAWGKMAKKLLPAIGFGIEKDIKKIGKHFGKPYEKVAGVNPFSIGYDLGHDVIAPALKKQGLGVNKGSTKKASKKPARKTLVMKTDGSFTSHVMPAGGSFRENGGSFRPHGEGFRSNGGAFLL